MLKLTKANENASIKFLDLTITNFGGLDTLSDEIKAESENNPT